MTRNADAVNRWLLEGDPAIRWQVLRDVVETAERTVERERAKVGVVGRRRGLKTGLFFALDVFVAVIIGFVGILAGSLPM